MVLLVKKNFSTRMLLVKICQDITFYKREILHIIKVIREIMFGGQ